jgi:hypothetical protein
MRNAPRPSLRHRNSPILKLVLCRRTNPEEKTMPRTGGGRYNREDVDEKKDHPRKDGSERGDQKASHDDRFDEPQDKQARGSRIDHMAGGNKPRKSPINEPEPETPTSNTTSGGNRAKGVHHRQGRQDHN